MELYNWTSGDRKFETKARWADRRPGMAKNSSLKKYSAFKPYLTDLLKVSLITGVPQIAADKSKVNRCIKVIVICLCIVGFVYQTLDFLRVYRAYQTNVNVLLSEPTEIVQPAVTLCNTNIVRRKALCEQKRDMDCSFVQPDFFCQNYPFYCPTDREKYYGVPYFNYFVIGEWYWDKVMIESHDESMIHWCYKTIEGKKVKCSTEYQMVPVMNREGERTLCYAIESLWNHPEAEPDTYPNNFVMDLEFFAQPEEYIQTTNPILLQVAVHERKRLVNPFDEGEPLLAGRTYEAKVSMTEKEMLPPPYDTNCVDYIELWRKNNGTGPLNDKMCMEQCKLNTLVENGMCVDRNVNYPNMEETCYLTEISVTDEMVENCSKVCMKPCFDQSYEVKYSEISNFKHECNNSVHCEHDRLRIIMTFRTYKVTKYLYLPKYESVELFSYIGGYMGMWLGISLVSLFDLLLTIMSIIYFPIGNIRWKKQTRKTKSLIRIPVRSLSENYNQYPY